jgi:hypothetical protein
MAVGQYDETPCWTWRHIKSSQLSYVEWRVSEGQDATARHTFRPWKWASKRGQSANPCRSATQQLQTRCFAYGFSTRHSREANLLIIMDRPDLRGGTSDSSYWVHARGKEKADCLSRVTILVLHPFKHWESDSCVVLRLIQWQSVASQTVGLFAGLRTSFMPASKRISSVRLVQQSVCIGFNETFLRFSNEKSILFF